MKNLLLLHGAVGSSTQLEPLAEILKGKYKIYLMNFSGHGGKEIPDEPFRIEMFAKDVIYLLDKAKLNDANVFGYSMGGYVALYVARHYPGLLNKIFTAATKFDWNEETAIKESKYLNPEIIAEKIPAYADQLIQRHSKENWKSVLHKTAEMMINLGEKPALTEQDFTEIGNEVRLCVGDKDSMVSIEETAVVYRNLKKASLLVMPDTQHPIEKIQLKRLLYEINEFFC